MKDDRDEYVIVENEYISVSIDSKNGVIRQIHNKAKNISLIMEDLPNARLVPWRVGTQEENWIDKIGVFDLKVTWIDEFESFKFSRDKEGSLNLAWNVNPNTCIEAKIEIPKESPNVYFYVELKSKGKEKIARLEYPIIQGIGILGGNAERNYLAHPHATGVLFRNPFSLFKSAQKRPISFMLSTDRGLPFSIYPDGYAGSAMQFMVYYCKDLGGFYMGCHDGEANVKAINFYKNMDCLLEASFVHEKPDLSDQNLKVSYPVVIGSLFRGDWYEGAERYKEWAKEQKWCEKGPLWKRVEEGTASRWLVEGVGFSTFGVNSRYDRSHWFRFFHNITGKPVFHILGVNWPKVEADYLGRSASTFETWFPAKFHPKNLEVIKENGDYFAPFEFDIMMGGWEGLPASWRAAGWAEVPESWREAKIDEIKKSLLVVPRMIGYGIYTWGYVCPFTKFLRDLHVWRDEKLVKEYGADANYYDISFSNVLMMCFSTKHGHPVGGGKWMVDAWRRLAIETKEATTRAKDMYVPQGTEVIVEPFIGELDYYQARANGSPCSPMEIDFWREWIKQGKAEKIPMFEFVYHEYGPVRLDGWAKVSREIGDLFYWMTGRTVLWGGLLELNYEFSPLEVVDGEHENASEHYYSMRDRRYQVDSEKLEFIRETADARTSFAKDYLAYGTMVRPLKTRSQRVELDWFSYNSLIGEPSYEDRGVLPVSSIIHSAWSFKDNLGFIFLNLRKEHEKTKVSINPQDYGLKGHQFTAYIINREGKTLVGTFGANDAIECVVELPPRKVVLLELRTIRKTS